jgi:phage-related protein
MNTFPWNDIGYPFAVRERNTFNVIKSPFESGHVQKRLRFTRALKTFEVTWRNMYASERLALLEFWRLQQGPVISFYWRYPTGIADMPLADGVTSDGEIPSGYDTTVDSGAGDGPTFKVCFADDFFEEERDARAENIWREVTVRMEQVI